MSYVSKPKIGRIIGAVGTNPASGSEIAWQIPTDKFWRLMSAAFSMWASSGSSGTSRSPHLIVSGSDGTTYYKIYSGHDYTSGSGTITYYWISGLPLDTLHTGSGTVVAPLPEEIILSDNQVVGTSTDNFDVSDNWTAPTFLVQEWEE